MHNENCQKALRCAEKGLSSLGVSPYSYNSSNELTSTPNATYSYDSNGNTTSKTDSTGTTNYTWDYENRLASVTLPGTGGTVTSKYDPFGRRAYKSSSSGTSIYAYDGDNLIEETNSSGGVVARYAETQDIDESLAESRSGTTSYYEADGLGSVTSLTNAAGSLAQTYTFDSFGKTTNSTGSLTNHFRYTGREFDSETGLYFYRARYYDPNAGRFLNEDPIGFDSGVDSYAYVLNDPVDWFDPDGTRQHRRPNTAPPGAPLSIGQITQLVAANNKSGQSDQLIICLIYKESTFYPKGRNPASTARGLMGVTNRAARSLKVDPRNLSDPATNIRTGCRYLHRRIDWSEPFGSEGSVWEGLYKYGTRTDDYPDSLLECEECMKANSKCLDCQMKECLMPLHGGQ